MSIRQSGLPVIVFAGVLAAAGPALAQPVTTAPVAPPPVTRAPAGVPTSGAPVIADAPLASAWKLHGETLALTADAATLLSASMADMATMFDHSMAMADLEAMVDHSASLAE